MTVSLTFVQRAIEFYHRQKAIPVALSDIWKINVETHCAQLIQGLESKDDHAVSSFLEQFAYTSVTPEHQLEQKAISAATAWGLIPRWNPFQPSDRQLNRSEVQDKIESMLSLHIRSSWFSESEILNALCAVSNLTRDLVWPVSIMLEIGAGHGAVASVILKLDPLVEYHTIDLPFMSVVHAFKLSMEFGEDSVCFEGESSVGKRVIVHGVSKPDLTFPVVFNQDSMPEFEIGEQDSMIKYIERVLTQGGIFYSVNQESSRGGQRRVFDAANQCPSLRLVRRSPAWDKEPAYVEEVFVKT